MSRFRQFMQQHCSWVLDEQHDYGKLVDYNGLECFTLNVQHNHPDRPFYPLEVFEWVARNSTGSYGLLYFLNDEDPALYKEFQVYILKRGKLIKTKDSFLSPYFEEVEREYNPGAPPLD